MSCTPGEKTDCFQAGLDISSFTKVKLAINTKKVKAARSTIVIGSALLENSEGTGVFLGVAKRLKNRYAMKKTV